MPPTTAPCIIVHGGAWTIPQKLTDRSLLGVQRAAAAGYDILCAGGTALDAVQAAVVVLEDDPAFDAGRGSCLNTRGEVEMDSVIIVEGPEALSLRAGAVAGVSVVKNPVTLARRVMDDTSHCLLVGGNADAFARESEGIELVGGSEELVTEDARNEWRELNKYSMAVSELFNKAEEGGDVAAEDGHDTVGAVALDSCGRIAAATSTGGITNKMAGRVGDSPIIGSGAYVDIEFGGISTTGHGESIMKTVLAKHALQLVEHRGMSGREAASASLEQMLKKTGGRGGLIFIGPTGEVAHAFSTKRMAWCSRTKEKAESGIDPES